VDEDEIEEKRQVRANGRALSGNARWRMQFNASKDVAVFSKENLKSGLESLVTSRMRKAPVDGMLKFRDNDYLDVSRTLTLLQRNLLHSFNRACFMI
jgi:hypothetical protein